MNANYNKIQTVPSAASDGNSNSIQESTLPHNFVDIEKLIFIQSADPYLAIIQNYLMNQDESNLYHQLPPKMKQDLLSQKYHYRQNVLYFQRGSHSLVVLPPTKRFYAMYPLVTHSVETMESNETKSFYTSCCACYKCGETTHIAANCPLDAKRGWLCTYCGIANCNPFCVSCNLSISNCSTNPSTDENENEYESKMYNSSCSSHNSSPSTDTRTKNINGTTYYARIGDKLNDYLHLAVSPDHFTYDEYQYTLICGECDFSFTEALIGKRGNIGQRMLVTAWYYYKKQWYIAMPKEIGWKAFSLFLRNLKFCKEKGAKITFGIDARSLHCSEPQWNKTKVKGFDRILFTLPRVYDEKWSKIRYNNANKRLLFKILSCVKCYLNRNGEIHILLLKGQFFNWRVREVLNESNLKIAYWCSMNQRSLNNHFKGYIPRNYYGNPIKLVDYNFHFCSFKVKSN